MNQQEYLALAEIEIRKRKRLNKNYNWKEVGREKQLPPDIDWRIWMILAGRGFGKTRSVTEWARSIIEASKEPTIGALVGRTPADVRDVLIEGESGILNISPPWNRPIYEPSKRKLTWPDGTVAHTYSFENPDQLRGPQHHWAVVDELASARDSKSWDNLMFGLRLGDHPRTVIATTPRPTQLIRALAKDDDVVLTAGSTYENKENLPASFIKAIDDKYKGTRLGRQEIYAEILDDIEGALWTYEDIAKYRVKKHPDLRRIGIAIDPAVTNNEDSDETGINVAGLGTDMEGYILADLSMKGTPNQWAHEALRAYKHYNADCIIAETNNGGDMVKTTLDTVARTMGINYKFIKVHATRGKIMRAEPISALYEQGKVHHVGEFKKLEDQMCTYDGMPGAKSPDRLDALVWNLTDLMKIQRAPIIITA